MQVICTDGTVLQCQRFEAIDSGVLLFGESPQTETEEGDTADDEDEEAMAFVPLHQLRFVLPEGVQPGAAGAQGVAQSTPGAPPTKPPSTPGAPQQGRPPQRPPGQPTSPQGMGQQPSQFEPDQRR